MPLNPLSRRHLIRGALTALASLVLAASDHAFATITPNLLRRITP